MGRKDIAIPVMFRADLVTGRMPLLLPYSVLSTWKCSVDFARLTMHLEGFDVLLKPSNTGHLLAKLGRSQTTTNEDMVSLGRQSITASTTDRTVCAVNIDSLTVQQMKKLHEQLAHAGTSARLDYFTKQGSLTTMRKSRDVFNGVDARREERQYNDRL